MAASVGDLMRLLAGESQTARGTPCLRRLYDEGVVF